MNIANLVCCTLSLLPLHHRGHHETISAAYITQADVIIQHEIHRPAGPIVVISDVLPGSTIVGKAVSSADTPGFWSVVRNKPLDVVVKVPWDQAQANPDIGVQLFLDGLPVDESRSQGVKSEIEFSPTGQNLTSFPFRFECPSPGKHVLQARYLRNNVWSQLSPPLNFQVSLPPQPKIIAVSDCEANDYGGPLFNKPVQVQTNHVNVKLASVQEGDLVIGYLDGKKVDTACAKDCCVTFCLKGQAVPGTHSLSVRVVPKASKSNSSCTDKAAKCKLASPQSNVVKINFYNEDTYLLKPGLAAFRCDCEKRPKSNCCQEQDSDSSEKTKKKAKPKLRIEFHWPVSNNKPEIGPLAPTDGLSSLGSNGDEAPNESANASRIRFVGYVGTSPVVQDPVDATTLAVDAEIEAANKAMAKAKQFKTDSEEASMQAQRQHADISDLMASAEKAAKLAESFSKAAANELIRANKAVSETAVGDPGIHRSALAAKEKALVESVKAESASKLARKAFDNVKKRVEGKADLPAKNAQEMFESAKQNHTAAVSHARKAISLANDAVQARANDNMGIEREKRKLATEEAKRASEAADAVAMLANKISKSSDEVAKIKGLIVSEYPEIVSHRNNAKFHADRTREQANNSKQLARKSAAQKISSSGELTDVSQQRQIAESSLAKAISHAKTAEAAKRTAKTNAEDAEAHAGTAEEFRSATEKAFKNTVNTASKTDTDNKDYQDALSALGSATAANEVAQQSWQAALARARDTASQNDQAKASLAETRNQVRLAHEFLDKAETAMQKALEAANSGEVRSVMDHLNTNKSESIEGQRAVSIANAAAEKTRFYASQALKHATDAEKSETLARQYSDATARYANSAKIAAVATAISNRQDAQDETPLPVPGQGSAAESVSPSKERRQTESEPDTAKTAVIECDAASIAAKKLTCATNDANCAQNAAEIAAQLAWERAKAARLWARAEAAGRINLDFGKIEGEELRKRTFYMAAAAHFPIREFGPQGQLIQLEGAVIYEDMEFTFDEEGRYEIKFRMSTPNLPTDLMMQFHVQAGAGGPWYTLTMPHRKFKPQKDGSRGMHPQEFKGESEILKRCFGTVSNIRRTGSARFGFGVAGLGHLVADTE